MSDVAAGGMDRVVALKNPNVMTIKEVAAYLGRSAGWVYQNKDGLPHRKIGRLYLFHKEAIDEWIHGERPAVTTIEKRDPKAVAEESVKSKSKKPRR